MHKSDNCVHKHSYFKILSHLVEEEKLICVMLQNYENCFFSENLYNFTYSPVAFFMTIFT